MVVLLLMVTTTTAAIIVMNASLATLIDFHALSLVYHVVTCAAIEE